MAIYVEDDMDLPSDTDDEEERLDCVHAINGDEADAEQDESEGDYTDQRQPFDQTTEDSILITERRAVCDEDMDGDIEDADGLETERRDRKNRGNSASESEMLPPHS